MSESNERDSRELRISDCMNISHHHLRRLTVLLCSFSLVFGTSFSSADAKMSCKPVARMSCYSATAVVPCVHNRCCQLPAPKPLPLPLDQWKHPGNAGFKDYLAAFDIHVANANRVTPNDQLRGDAILPGTGSLIVQHVRLQI